MAKGEVMFRAGITGKLMGIRPIAAGGTGLASGPIVGGWAWTPVTGIGTGFS